MATAYSTITASIRAAIGDFGIRDATGAVISNSQDFHSDDIGSVITNALYQFPTYTGDGTEITPTIANDNDEGAIVYVVALLLALPGGTWSLEAPNMKYWKQTNQEMIAFFWGQIKYFMDGGSVEPALWGTLDQAYNEGILVADRIKEAVGAI